ncbi:MAG: hypothetical protein M3453_09215, partial [Pseudomonadota bacterium]|nr:hypothetical protein [Pseudomonadota bacterium]
CCCRSRQNASVTRLDPPRHRCRPALSGLAVVQAPESPARSGGRAMARTKLNDGSGKAARLSDAALVLLSHAADRENGMVLPPAASVKARGGALEKALSKLLRQGFVDEVGVANAEQAWRAEADGARIGLSGSAEKRRRARQTRLTELRSALKTSRRLVRRQPALPRAEGRSSPRRCVTTNRPVLIVR